MDTNRITDPITEHLPAAGAAIMSTVADVTTGLADQITDQVGQIDLKRTARRTRRTVAHYVPWMSTSQPSRFDRSPRWLVAGAAVVLVIAIVMVRRRSPGTTETRPRDDWSTSSPNGRTPPVESSADHATATSNA